MELFEVIGVKQVMTREKYIVPTYTRCWFAGAIAWMINEGKGIHEIANTLKAHPQLIEAFIFDGELKELCHKQSDAFLENLLLSVNDKDFFKLITTTKFFLLKIMKKRLPHRIKKIMTVKKFLMRGLQACQPLQAMQMQQMICLAC